MKRLLLIFSLFLLSACNETAVEDGDTSPTPSFETPVPVTPTVTEPAPATAVPTVTVPPTATTIPTAATTETSIPIITVVAPTPTYIPITPIMPGPIRIQFAPGATSATVRGHLAAGQPIEYLAWAAAGQHMRVEVISPNSVANIAITGVSDGQPYKRLVNEDRFWDGTLPLSQDYLIRVLALEEADYTLIVTIDPLD